MDTATASNLALFLIIWIPLCWAIGSWNQRKGNGFAVGFFMAFFLSPLIGAIVVAAVGENKREVDRRAYQTGEMKKCPFCAETIKIEAIKCRFCGSDLNITPDEGAQPDVKGTMQSKTITVECPSCHTKEEVEASKVKEDRAYKKFVARYSPLFGKIKFDCAACEKRFSKDVFENSRGTWLG